MKLRQAQIHHIQSSFATMSNRKDLADLLTYIKKLILGNKAYPIQVRDINFYINERDTDLRYHSFSIPKKNGSARTITAPRGGLKLIQRCVNVMLQQVFQPHPAAMGFVPGRSVQDNATIHIGKKYVYNLDLKDFFHSVDQARVWRCLQNPPFLLSREKRRLTLANVIAGLCCTELPVQRQNEFGEWKEVDRNVLPQGAPTSPTIVNIVAQRLDYKLAALAKRYKVQYSRYADDITFSADYNAFDGEGPLLSKVNKIIDDQSFVVNPVKVRLQKYNVRQEVTGIIVNEKANLPKAYASELRMWLYYWERYGRDRAESYFSQRYTTKGDMAAVLEGKVQYLRAIRGADDALAAKLGGRLKKLKERTSVIAEV
ncbi:MAG TPA: reverse transcriptase family protein, partial [Dinghuibacter sp.]|uniref:reverse transcriptase family protein n=1 Tax=Dinghuibacter sp. TaxID=2024697 RepID=UPI002C287829